MDGTKIIIGAVGSPQGRAAAERAAIEARRSDAEIVVVGHLDRPRGDEAAAGYKDALAAKEREVEAFAAEISAEHDVRCRAVVPLGKTTPADTLLHVAAQEQADLIVIGVRRRTRVGKLLLGSNAQDIILKADCPVLAVKAADGT